ncbi:MAG: hypothetical protein HY720_32885 [Planctomycetes bacterium]|nr:hypothetical protein [Planctomycetota bacterium]
MASLCDECGRRIAPDEWKSGTAVERGESVLCPDCAHREPLREGAASESFRCDGDGCGKVLPLRLLRQGAAAQVGSQILCPRCRIRILGRRARRTDAMAVVGVLAVVLVLPVMFGLLVVTGRSNGEDSETAPAANGPAPPLPHEDIRREPAASAPSLTREEIAEVVREILRGMREVPPPGAAPAGTQEPAPASETGSEPAAPERSGEKQPSEDEVLAARLEELDQSIDAAVREHHLAVLARPGKGRNLLVRISSLGAGLAVLSREWASDIEPYLATAEDEVVRSLAARVLGSLGTQDSAEALRLSAGDSTSKLAAESARHALFVLGMESHDGDGDIAWERAFANAQRVRTGKR